VSWLQALTEALEPLLRIAGRIHSPWSHKFMDQTQCDLIMKAIEPGDIILTRTRGEFTNILNPSYWKHSGIYTHVGIIEAVEKGVVKTKFYDYLMTKDHVAVVRPRGMSQIDRHRVIQESMNQVGKPYDFNFCLSPKAFYCFELCMYVWKRVRPEWGFEARERLGKMTVVGDDFFLARQYFDVIYTNHLSTNTTG